MGNVSLHAGDFDEGKAVIKKGLLLLPIKKGRIC